MSKQLPIERVAGYKGIKVITGAGAHTVSTRCIIARVADVQISAMTIGGASATLTDYFPAGTKMLLGEQWTFENRVTSITLVGANDSLLIVNE